MGEPVSYFWHSEEWDGLFGESVHAVSLVYQMLQPTQVTSDCYWLLPAVDMELNVPEFEPNRVKFIRKPIGETENTVVYRPNICVYNVLP